VAWRFKTDAFGPYPEYKLEGTPIMVKGVLYTTAGTRRSVVAIDAKTGELIWSHSLREGERAANSARQLSGRGVSYWTDGRGDERIIYVTTGFRLVELNAKTGAMIGSFADNGILDIKVGVQYGNNQQIDLERGEIGIHAAPTVTGDVVIVGSSMKEGATVPTHNNTKGVVRAFDVRSGKQLWRFDTIPRPGEFGNETWENNSWAINGNTGVWAHMTVDEDLGLVYIPVETPSSDFYGGHRPGNNLFAESLVAVDLKTGVRKWHFQFVHHPIWNWDMTSAPILSDINVNGRPVKAVSVASKQGWLYVFDRTNGQPVWPIEERPVPQSDVPGEKTSATQPFPPDSLNYASNFLKVPDDVIDFTPELRQKALDYLKRYKVVPSPFAPGVLGDVKGTLGAIVAGTATNWPGFGYDPDTHTAFMPAGNTPERAVASGAARRVLGYPVCAGHCGTAVPRNTGARRLLRRRCTADRGAGAPRPQPGGRKRQSASRRLRRTEHRRAADLEAALRSPCRHRPRQRATQVADAARRYARPGAQSSGAQGAQYPEDRPGPDLGRRPRHHQDAGDHGRPGGDHHAGASARRHAAGLRQGDRAAGRRRVHPGPAERQSDDLHGGRQAVHRGRGQRRQLFGRIHRVQPAELIPTDVQ
jgi:outer membrane protein assembly factor BamB